ncbi:hypothetical protein FA95DRAFT_1614395 [Auriscalpium vulgare]|uniref:Uncharacterized protein n=1 Tax=Auriscalpium vulgare TaxID=40419 RepID=A0ACB8QZQ5_9AGAM|nr:hypothetical protein FA95DRAFT_1614395 [Auriscalpium vulgare]
MHSINSDTNAPACIDLKIAYDRVSREEMVPFPFPLAFWTSDDESDTVVIAANTSFIPCPMPSDPPPSVHVQSDGLWGVVYQCSSPWHQ